MSNSRVTKRGGFGGVQDAARVSASEGINAAIVHLKNRVVVNIGNRVIGGTLGFRYKRIGNTKEFAVNSEGARIKKASSRSTYVSSLPWNFPNKRIGVLQKSISIAPSSASVLRALCGTNIRYGKYLEYGTTRMLPRPWLGRTLSEQAATMKLIAGMTFRARFDGFLSRMKTR